MVRINTYQILFLAVLFAGCSSENKSSDEIDYSKIKQPLLDQNKIWFQEEMQSIESFIKRRNWNMTPSGTGLYYTIYSKVDTLLPKIKEGQVARVNFTVSILGDTLTECYTSDGEPEDFLVGMDHVESGLHEGILFMRKGEKAKLILPSHLAYGLIGDQDVIPPKSTLVYDIELMDIIDTEQSAIIEKNNAARKKREENHLKNKQEETK